jgi:predicted signal transduction protein with EAL and GGDEF domain
VETPEQIELLKHLGCDQLQGHGVSRPLPAAEYEQLIRTAERQRRLETEPHDLDATMTRLSGVPQLAS